MAPTPGDERGVNPFLELYHVLRQHTLELLNKNKSVTGEHAFLSATDISLVDAHLASTVSLQVKELRKQLFILNTTMSLAPFLGLLGTVWGILITFAELQSRAVGSASEMMLGGLSLALTTTVFGLIVAIPALVAHSYLRSHIRDFEAEMEDFANTMLAAVEVQYRKVDITASDMVPQGV